MKNILVTGISGFLGWHLYKGLPKKLNLIGIYNQTPPKKIREFFWELDLNDFNRVLKFLNKRKIDAIIHAAAVSSLQACEKNPDYAYRNNVVIPTLLADYARERGIPFVFLSSDQVFDGKTGLYAHDDYPTPVNLYGKQKLEAEKRILTLYPKAAVLRLPLLYGYTHRRQNFIWEWSKKMQHGEKVHAFTDEFRTPISGEDAAKGIYLLLEKKCKGVWHLGGTERLSRYEMALLLAKSLGFKSKLVKGVSLSEVDLPVARPADVSLISARSYSMGFAPLPFSESLDRLSSKLGKKLRK
jgi:dTDP-4-dehydrorhamnose reductase